MMQDPDQTNPSRSPIKRRKQEGRQSSEDEELDEFAEGNGIKRRRAIPPRASRGPSSRHTVEQEYEEDAYQGDEIGMPPPHSTGSISISVITGVIAGTLIAILNIVLTYLNANTYNAAAEAAGKAANSYAGIIVGLWCLNITISLLVCFGIGFVMGKTRTERRAGFYAGAIAGAVMYVGSFVVNYIPNYPGHINNTSIITAGNVAGGLVTAIAILLIQAFIGGLFGLWGAWTATRNNYYEA